MGDHLLSIEGEVQQNRSSPWRAFPTMASFFALHTLWNATLLPVSFAAQDHQSMLILSVYEAAILSRRRFSDTVTNRGDSDVMSLGASVGGPSILREESPVGKRKGPNKQFRVKPAYCFDHPVYMTDSEIHQLMLQPSRNVQFLDSYIAPSSKRTKRMDVRGETERIWGTTDDGRVGSLRVEVLGCMGLAPVSPDVSVYLICGDVPFATDVLPSCRSPRWPPNCKRAAVFPVHHAYARLFAGVFASKKDKTNDQFCGRVVIDLAALATEYGIRRHSTITSILFYLRSTTTRRDTTSI